jgi:hypothetical protein
MGGGVPVNNSTGKTMFLFRARRLHKCCEHDGVNQRGL